MAIIPGSAKVLNQYENVNTTYGGSKAMKAQSRWYTMDDVIETIEAEGGGVSGSGTTNYVPKFTGTEEIGDSQIFDNGTNVGIGTDTPIVNFQVEGTVLAGFSGGDGGYLSVAGDNVQCMIQSPTTPNIGMILTTADASFGVNPGGDLLGVKVLAGNRTYFENSTGQKFGLQEGDNLLVTDNGIIQDTVVPSNPITPVKWIRINDIASGDAFLIPVYS
jgi:hypothetical protein